MRKYQTLNFSVDDQLRTIMIKPKYIMYHHTGTTEFKWTLSWLLWSNNPNTKVSAHFLIDKDWGMHRLSNPEFRTWHAGKWNYKWITDMNSCSIWIEVMWPYNDMELWFYDEQRKSLKELTLHLMFLYKIPKENVIRHKDYAPWRKVDIDDRLWYPEFKTFEDWKNAKL